MSTTRDDDLGALYDTLARFQWGRRRWSRARAGEGLELRKRLLPPAAGGDAPADGAADLDRWMHTLLGNRPVARVLDLGCGFGITAQRWAVRTGGAVVGITQSGFQVEKATAAAVAAGLGERCTFRRADFAAPLQGPFDVVLAIEALGHAADLAAVLRNVREALAPGGMFLWLEDLLVRPLEADADTAELARRWSSPPLRSVATVRSALAAAGFVVRREVDLTAQVGFAPPEQLAAQALRLGRWHRIIPLSSARRLFDAFLGGVALERLYARGAACYRVWMSERPMEAV